MTGPLVTWFTIVIRIVYTNFSKTIRTPNIFNTRIPEIHFLTNSEESHKLKGVKWFVNREAKDNVSKYFYDISKIIVGTAVIAPFINQDYSSKTVLLGFLTDKKEL
ncbi:MAG: hypothetical protein MAG551_02605 [Candidatus Scalindua arabica]|uniref:Uncharacterized protein n=1 Tax=Candidatus Scalindua arabica TaxID=1127984 RepID=A0A941W592_9BACT|nr:hypothetical protein [Candidatus Scalindua arabica]